jgi:hypothetical protein
MMPTTGPTSMPVIPNSFCLTHRLQDGGGDEGEQRPEEFHRSARSRLPPMKRGMEQCYFLLKGLATPIGAISGPR